ncbi:Het-C-domain-containing protein [Phlegmacium glaucopus]|nr:Het-C-domain-containing protein [Phlegmacium glaucopus]
MARNTILLIVVFICVFCISQNVVHAFGAGNIPSFAYMEGKAFRHGDIEDVLSQLIKRGAGGLVSMLSKGSKFNGLDIKRVYFGNWLRDYSQAVDVTSLKKVQLQTIITLCMALGFMAHGYATHEFEVTPERLGVYLPTEHIDNPKGYADGEDARQYHPQLRGPVDPRELEIDHQTGMKNYIANEQGRWDTSKALVRRTLERCIQIGRQNRASGQKHDEYEAFRLLGQALHTLEDFSAHSNFCELTLISMGHEEVFPHVGEHVRIQAPNGKYVAPLVTGTFGSSDFTHSLLGEASDHLSEASVTDLNKELAKARSKSLESQSRGGPGANSPADVLRGLLFTLPGGTGSDMSRDLDSIERMRAGPTSGGGKRPEDMTPQELHSALWQILTFRDSVAKKIAITIEKIPGLESLVDKIMDSISVFVFTSLEPFLKPILQTATSSLQTASGDVIDNRDQYEVFNDPRASDPTHSFLSKDHFNLLLNEPAGQIAQRIVLHTVKLVTKAWDDNSVNVHQLTEDVLQCLFHPDFHNPQSQIQREMMQCVRDWLSRVPSQHSVLQRLSKESVKNHQNVRREGEGGAPAAQGSFAEGQAHQLQHSVSDYAQSVVPGVGMFTGGHGHSKGTGVGGGAGYPPGAPSGYPQAGGHQYGGPPSGGPGYPGGPMGGGGHQHGGAPPMAGQSSSYYNENKPPGGGGGGYGSTSMYTPSAAVPPLPHSGHSGPAQHHSGSTQPHHAGPPQPQHGGYTPSYAPSYGNTPNAPPSFPGSGPSFPGQGDDGFSSPGGPGLSFPDSNAPSFPGGPPSFPSGGHSGHHGHHGGGGYHAPPPHGDGYGGFPGGPAGFGGGGPPPAPFGFPGTDTYPSGSSAPSEFPGGNNPPSYPYGGGGGGGGGW